MSSPAIPSRFTVRVYGILIHQNNILLADEQIGDFAFTKFPGGGLEFGEGTEQCLLREYTEETGLEIEMGPLVYVNDFYIQSRIAPEEQVIAVYYQVFLKGDSVLTKTESIQPFRGQENKVRLRWVAVEELKPELLTFDSDRAALRAFREG